MAAIVTKAFVMNSFPWKDRHRLLHLLTPEQGLITAMAPASESLRSKLRGGTQLFSLGEFTLTDRQGRFSISDGTVIESFASISQDLDRLAAASHAAEVFSDVARNDEPRRRLFDLWAYTLYEVASGQDPVFAAQMGCLRLMGEIGFPPCLDACVLCQKIPQAPYAFSYRAGGLLCLADQAAGGQEMTSGLSEGTLALLRHVISAPFPRLFRFQAGPGARSQASCFADRWVEEKMEKRYKRLAMLDQCLDFICPRPKEAKEDKEDDSLSQLV
ncbi:MAG: DNA repair protein RecO [Saccharofermentanales bacterium]